MIDKALTLLKFVKKISMILNNNPDFIQSTKDLNYSYYIKVVSDQGQEITKFTLGLQNGSVSITPHFKPDIILTLTESAFFGIIRGTVTLEETYFAGQSDLWSAKGDWSTHLPGLKLVFDKIEMAVRNELGEV
jgi:hypothetical protein